MIDTLRRNPLTAALGVACALLVATVVFELTAGGGPSVGASARKVAAAEAKLLPPLASAAPEQVYPESVSRPLWIPTRRPAPAPTVAPASFARGQFILQGVTIAGSTRIAMLKEKASGRMHRIEKGRDVNGIQVAEVEPDKVTLAQGDEREVVELRVQRPGAPGATPPPFATPGAGPFASTASSGAPGAAPAPPPPAAPPAGSPFGAPPRPPQVGQQTSPGPLAPTTTPPGSAPAVSNPSASTMPQPATSAPMTPEELLARRRARRNQSP